MINVMCTHSAVGAIYQIKCSEYKTIATRIDRVADQSSELHLITWKHRKEHKKMQQMNYVVCLLSYSVCIRNNVRLNFENHLGK
jgi:hypothetical protein